MVVPPVALHVGGLGHVAINAFAAFFLNLPGPVSDQIYQVCSSRGNEALISEDFMVTMSQRINHRRISDAAVVAAKTKKIAGQQCLAGMRIVTIEAVDPSLGHFAAEERTV